MENLDIQSHNFEYIPYYGEEKEVIKYTIFYAFGFEFNGKLYGFKSKSLQEISGASPKFIPQCENSGSKGWWLDRKWMSFSHAKGITKEINKTIDATHLEFYVQMSLEVGMNPSIHLQVANKNTKAKPKKEKLNLRKWLKDNREQQKNEQ